MHELAVGGLRLSAEMPDSQESDDPKGAWWTSYLAGRSPRALRPLGGRIRAADLYCGPGGLSNGIRHLCEELGVALVTELAVDQDEVATLVYAANHPTRRRSMESVNQLVDYTVRHATEGARFHYTPELLEDSMSEQLNGLDLVLAGPPCQGH